MTVTIQDRFKLRRGTAAALASVNPVPLDSEIIIESDTGTSDGARKFKVGDGVTAWNALPYFTLTDTILRCRLATAAALPANTYSNGASGVGATLTMTATGVLTVDSVVAALGDVVLVNGESTASHNGIYRVTTAGAVGIAAVLTRYARFATSEALPGRLITIGSPGTVNANTVWQSTTVASATIGTTAITFARVSGSGDAQFVVASGTADALTADFSPDLVPVNGLQVRLRAAFANATTAPTLAVDGGSALAITKNGNRPLATGDIYGAGHELLLRYVSSTPRWELLNPASGGGVLSIVPGAGISVDATDPLHPAVSATSPGTGIGAHRYWRFSNMLPSALKISGAITTVAMCEFRLRSTAGGTNLAISASTASNTFSGLSVANLYDGSNSTVWGPDASFGSFNHWLVFDLGSAKAVREIYVQARNDATYYAQAANIFNVQYSDDALMWVNVCLVAMPAFTSPLQAQTAALPA